MFGQESDVKTKEVIFSEIKRKIFIISFRSELFKMDEQNLRLKISAIRLHQKVFLVLENRAANCKAVS